MDVIVVDSVKGGCGKTLISIKKATQLAYASNDNKVCYIDLDLLGSSIETFLFGEYVIGGSKLPVGSSFEVIKQATNYLNQMLYKKNFDDSFFTTIRYREIPSSNPFDIIMCSPKQFEKDKFKPTKELNYIEQIDYGYFAVLLKKMFKTLRDDLHYTHVIVDMPPNSDAYTDLIFNIFLNAYDKSNSSNKYEFKIMLINSLDQAHFAANMEWLKSKIETIDMKSCSLNMSNVEIVFNDRININTIKDPDIKDFSSILLTRITSFDTLIPSMAGKLTTVYYYDYDAHASVSAVKANGIKCLNINSYEYSKK